MPPKYAVESLSKTARILGVCDSCWATLNAFTIAHTNNTLSNASIGIQYAHRCVSGFAAKQFGYGAGSPIAVWNDQSPFKRLRTRVSRCIRATIGPNTEASTTIWVAKMDRRETKRARLQLCIAYIR